MGREYATTLELSDVAGRPVSARRVAEIVGAWAGDSEPWSDGRRSARDGAMVLTRVLDPGDGEVEGWRSRFIKPDVADPSVTWTVEVEVVAGPRTIVTVELLRDSTDGVVRPLGGFGTPKVIARLLDAGGISAKDSRFPVSTSVSRLDASSATATLGAFLFDARRRLPVVGISLRDDDAVDGQVLLDQLAGNVHVWMIDDRASWALQRCLPQGLNVYNGAVRLWWPGLREASARWQHPLWLPRDPSHRVESRIRDAVVHAAVTRFQVPTEMIDLDRRWRLRLQANARHHREHVEQELLEREAASTQEDRVALEEAREAVATAQRQVDAAEKEAIEALERAETGEARVAELSARLASAKEELEFWRTSSDRTEADVAIKTAEERFSDEVTELFDREFASVGGQTRQMSPFRLGGEFLASLEDVGAPRSKVVRVCAQIVGRLQAEFHTSLQDHPLRANEAGGSPPRRRSSDGAEARRCSIENIAAAARRVHYWRTPAGEIELAAVVRHDDMRIPER